MRFYRQLNAYFEKRPEKDKILRRMGKSLTGTFYLAYTGLCIGLLIRAAINAPRPADMMPEIHRDGAKRGGKSFPSRHCFSAAVIAAAFAWINPCVGAAAAVAAMAMAVQRVLEGEHFIRDAAAGLLYGAVFGWLGFFLKKR